MWRKKLRWWTPWIEDYVSIHHRIKLNQVQEKSWNLVKKKVEIYLHDDAKVLLMRNLWRHFWREQTDSEIFPIYFTKYKFVSAANIYRTRSVTSTTSSCICHEFQCDEFLTNSRYFSHFPRTLHFIKNIWQFHWHQDGFLFPQFIQPKNTFHSACRGKHWQWYVRPPAFIRSHILNIFTILGKTTFLKHFEKFNDVCLLTEPVEQWRNLQ